LAALDLEERAGTCVFEFEAYLQAQHGGSGERLPYGHRAVAPRIISLLNFEKLPSPHQNWKKGTGIP